MTDRKLLPEHDTLAVRFARRVVRHRWWVLAAAILVALGAASGARNLAFDNDYRVFFSEDNPQLLAFEELQRTYTKVDNVLFAVSPRSGDVFDPEVLDAVETITAEAWTLPFALRVDSVTNFQHTEATEDDLVVADLVEGGAGYGEAELERARAIALSEPTLREFLVASDSATTGVNVTFQMPEESLDEVPIAVAASRELAARIEAEYPVDVHLTGMVMLNNAFFESSMRDMSTLVPLMYLVILIVAFVLLRSFAATVGTFFVLLFSLAAGMGLAGWVGIKLTPPSSAAPTIILTLAVADSIHILVSLLGAMRGGMKRHEAIVESLRINLQPVFLTSVTTMIGFLSMNFSDAPPFRDLGNITTMGVGMALILSSTLLPAFLAIVPFRVRVSATADPTNGFFGKWADAVVGRARPVLIVSVLAAVGLLAFIPSNELNDDFVNYFDTSMTFRQDVDTTTERLTGIYQLQFSLPAGESNGIADPEFLARADGFVTWLRAQPEVRHVSSITDTFRRLNKNLHADDPEHFRLPEERELAAQYLLLYELSLPYGLDLNNQLNVDKSATQVIATLDNMSSIEMREITARAEGWLAENEPSLAATGIGPAIMFAFISERNVKSMLVGTLLAVVLISGILAIALRSLRIGFLSLVPNLLPAGLAFGLWGVLDGEVNVAVSMVAGMTLGIVVDDTIHFLSKYLRARREKGLDARDAVRYAFSTVGRAIVVTSVILVAGFGVLAQSSFAMNSSMATLTAIAIVMALLADLFLLPALLVAIDRGARGVVRRAVPSIATAASGIVGAVGLAGLLAIGGALSATDAVAATAEERGLEIAQEADRHDDGFGDSKADLVMTLRNRHGQETQRLLRTKTLEVADDGDKSLIVFDNPGDVKGTAFLSFTHKAEPDDQWLYLPALKRVKRIASSNKSGPFVGSEFAYEDIASQEVEKYTYRYVEDASLDGRDHFVVERDPVDPKSGYTRQLVWFDQAEYRPFKIEFYDRGDKLLKTLTYHGYRQYLDRYWRADRMEMVNHQTGKSTVLEWNDYVFGNGFDDGDFNRASLAKAR